MKLRAKKAKRSHAGRIRRVCARVGVPGSGAPIGTLLEIFGPRNVTRTSRPLRSKQKPATRDCRASATLKIPLLATMPAICARDQARSRQSSLHPQQNGYRYRRTAAGRNSERAEISRRDGALCRLPEAIANTRELSSRLDFTRQSWLRVSRYCENEMSCCASAHKKGAPPLWRPSRAARARSSASWRSSKAQPSGYFLIVWDIVNSAASRASGQGAARRQQRRLLRARHHGGRSGRHGAVV